MTSVVITGATGFIGTHLIQELLNKDCMIYAVIRPKSKHLYRIPENERIKIIELKMEEYDKLPEQIPSADVFYHLAWDGIRPLSRLDQELQKKNYMSAVMAMEVAHKMGIRLFIGSGSQAEYGKIDGVMQESVSCNPTTEYGKYKLKAYCTLNRMSKSYGICLVWIRIFSLYGANDSPETLIISSIEKMKKNEPVKIAAPNRLWDYLFIEDAVKAMALFSEIKCDAGIYNLASGDIRPLKNYVEDIRAATNSKSRIIYETDNKLVKEQFELRPSIEKIVACLNWKPEVNFTEGIKKIVEKDRA